MGHWRAYALVLGIAATGCTGGGLGLTVHRGLDQEADALARRERALAFFQRGEALLEQQPRLAIARFEQALALDPSLAEAHHRLGRCRYALGDYEGERVEYKKCLALEPGYLPALKDLGDAAFVADARDEARGAYLKYLELQQDARVMLDLAIIEDRLGNRDEAAELRRLAAQLPDAPLPGRNLVR